MTGSKVKIQSEAARKPPFWGGFISATLMALGGSGLLALSLFATARLLRSESLGFAQQAVGDTHRLLSSQIQRELNLLQDGLTRVGDVLLRNTLEKGAPEFLEMDGAMSAQPLAQSGGSAEKHPAAGSSSNLRNPSDHLTAGSAHLEKMGKHSLRKPAAKGKAVVVTKVTAPPVPSQSAPVVTHAPIPIPHLPSGVLQVSLWAHGLGDSSPSVRAESLFNPKYVALSAQVKPLFRAAESLDRALVEEAFKSGRGLLLAQNIKRDAGRAPNILSVALQVSAPVSGGANAASDGGMVSGRGVLLAHYKLDAIDAILNADLLARSVLLDSRGRSLAGEASLGSDSARVFILEAVKARRDRSGLIQDFPGSGSLGAAAPVFASFTRFQQFPLSLITAISEGDVLTGMDSLARIAIASVVAVFLILFVLAFSQARRQWRKLEARKDLEANSAETAASAEDSTMEEARRIYGSVLVVTLRGLQGNLDQAPLLLSVSELLKDFRGLLSATAQKSGGEWIQDLDASFAIAFEDPILTEGTLPSALPPTQTSAFRCVQFALELRKQWHVINTTRATEGHAPAYLGMAVHSAHGLKVPKERGLNAKFVTPIIHEARTLERLAASLGQDFLIPKNVFETLRTLLKVDLAGEAYLGDVSGLTAYYRVLGYLKGADGKEELIETPWMKTPIEGRASAIQMVEGSVRWFINNGSGIIGPFSPGEISGQLFAQEIDFDCECWREDRGETRTIRESDLFTGSEDAGAVLWVYDGKLVHGPLSPGFLATAVRTGAIREQGSFLCEGSTVAGWKALAEWRAAQIEASSSSGSSSEASSSSGSSSEASSSSGSSTTPAPGATSAA